jgi:integrase
MAQRGQILKLRTRRPDGKAVWAYRYRVDGRCSKRPQVGGFATRAEAERALKRTLAHLRPGATITLAELVEEYLRLHQAAPATLEKLRWLLAKSTAVFGNTRLIDLRSEQIRAWRATLPEGHRFEATQALRQVLNCAVAWQLIDVNPAKRGVANPLRRFPEKRPFESWAEVEAIAGCLGPIAGPTVTFAAATGLRPAELVALERRDVDDAGGVVYVRRQFVRARSSRRRRVEACGLYRCSRSHSRHSTACRTRRVRCFFRHPVAATSICTTSARGNGDRRSSPRGSSHSDGPMTCVTPTPPSRSAPASPSSSSPGSWARAWR